MTELITAFFHNPSIKTDHHKSLEKVFFKQLRRWEKYIDRITIIDTDWWITESVPKMKLIKSPSTSHWKNLADASKESMADNLLFLDQDMLVWNPDVIKDMYTWVGVRNVDVCAILDGSGEQLFEKNEFRASRARICPYLCLCKHAIITQANYDFDPDINHDTMGKITKECFNHTFSIQELPDDRSSVYLRNGEYVKSSNLDGPGFSWSEPINEAKDYGYYHIRNATLGLEMCEEFFSNEESYERRKASSPDWEVFRSLAWWFIFDEIAENTEGQERIHQVVLDMGISKYRWGLYIDQMKGFHTWIKDL